MYIVQKNYSDHYIKKFHFSFITIRHNMSARSYVCIFTQMVFITLDYQYNSGKNVQCTQELSYVGASPDILVLMMSMFHMMMMPWYAS